MHRAALLLFVSFVTASVALGCAQGGGSTPAGSFPAPGSLALGASCTGDSQCASGACLPLQGGSVCSVPCTASAPCTPPARCEDLGAVGSWCVAGACTPSCGEAVCGDDGCGGSCGECADGQGCTGGQCGCAPRASTRCHEGDVWWVDGCNRITERRTECAEGCADGACRSCVADCRGRNCGDNGCGGSCGDCSEGTTCSSATGTCVTGCVSSCEGRQCGDDGCEGSCGRCTGGKVCQDHTCVCTANVSTGCHDGDVWSFDSCGSPTERTIACETGCKDGRCENCVPTCGAAVCGADGCGGTCGECEGGKECAGGACVCTPRASSACNEGDVWWLDSCGTPTERIAECEHGCADAQCLGCEPSCGARQCGPDGCGGVCGRCEGGRACNEGVCECAPKVEHGCHGDAVWWFDSCGTATELVAQCEHGCRDGRCESCAPTCGTRRCGSDGCGGTCGECGGGRQCMDGTCECVPKHEARCHDGDLWWLDSCGVPTEIIADCEHGCADGVCQSCVAACSDRDCGTDGCGGSCGSCTGGKSCEAGRCTCLPRSQKTCHDGDVWWRDSCGELTERVAECDFGCSAGACEGCAPACGERTCGPDPVCGSSCGTCTDAGLTCSASGRCGEWCEPGTTTCADDYAFRGCGPSAPGETDYAMGPRIPCARDQVCQTDTSACTRTTCLEAEVLYVLDRSSSMLEGDTWTWVRSSVERSLRLYQARGALGLRQFPYGEGCTADEVVAMARNNAGRVIGEIETPGVSASTPIETALAGLADHYGDAGDGQAAILLTDGDQSPACGTAQGAVDAAARLWHRGVRVFAIAVTTTANKAFLDSLARAGGTSSARLVTDGAELLAALDAVMQELDACLCGGAETRCDDRCVDTKTDTGHCGGCGSPVAPPRICRAGAPTCPTLGDAYCPVSDVCADLQTSTSHCGACENPTGSARICQEGVPVCRWNGYSYCPDLDECKDLSKDRNHCGTCGNDLPYDQVCENGVPTCSYDYDLMCDGSCIYPDEDHCGSCERVCSSVAGTERDGCTRDGKCTYQFTSTSRQRCSWLCSGKDLDCVDAEIVRWSGMHWRDKGCDYDPPHYNGGYFESIDCVCKEK